MPAVVLEAPLLPVHEKSPPKSNRLPEDDDDAARILNVAKLAGSFFFVYSAMDAISEYITSVLPHGLGDESLFFLQAALCASALIAPKIVSRLGELRSMMVGGTAHVLYLACLVKPVKFTVLCSSLFCGFGASLTWVAQGTFLTRSSPPSKRGLYAGVFWGIYYLSGIVGNLVAFFIFKYLSQAVMFGVGSASAAIGVLLILVVKDVSKNLPTETFDETNRLEGGGRNMILLFLLVLPMTFYLGSQSSFCTGEFTKLLPPESIGLVLLVAGLGQVVGSFFLSWLSDLLHCGTPTFLFGAASSTAGLIICIPLHGHVALPNQRITGLFGKVIFGAPVLAYLVGLLFGFADGVITSHVFALMGRIFRSRKPEIWAFFNLIGTAGAAATLWTGIMFPLSNPTGLFVQIRTQLAVLAVGGPLYIIIDIWSACGRSSNDRTVPPEDDPEMITIIPVPP